MKRTMPKPSAARVLASCLSIIVAGTSSPVSAMDCSKLLDLAADLKPPLRVMDSNIRSAWSSDAAPFLSEGAMSVVNFPGIPDQYLLMTKSTALCKSEGCFGQVYSFSGGVSYFSRQFAVTSNAVMFSWIGFYETTPLLPFSDVTRESAKRQVGSYVAFDEVDFQTLYADGVEIKQPSEWTNFGGSGYGAIPAKLFSYALRATKPECEL